VNPADIGARTPFPVAPLVYYPLSTPLGVYGTANPYFNGTGGVAGAVLPEGSASLLFFGTHGVGTYCYGTAPPCTDPESPYQSPHGYPYVYRVWAYDANELAAVTAGTRKPWDVRPYAWWDLTLPTVARKTVMTGVAYDAATGRIFIGQGFADGDAPVIHVFAIP
jgi:hypothetical protein